MGERIVKELILEGLDCANCAAKIEDRVSALEGIRSVSLNFVTKTLTIETSEGQSLPHLLERTKEIVRRVEPDVTIQEKEREPQEEAEGSPSVRKILLLGVGSFLFLLGLLLPLPPWGEWSLFLSSYLLVGGGVVYHAVRNLLRGQFFDETFLMTLATIGAFAIGMLPEGVAVMLFFEIGEFLQDLTVHRARRSIRSLLSLRSDFANLLEGEKVKEVPPEEINVGDLILVRPGERIPLDGKVVKGSSSLDTSALTGESMPREVHPGDEVLSGSINLNGLLTLEVTKNAGESTVAKILKLVQHASAKKAQTEQFITRFARYYTPVVVFAAVALALLPPLLFPEEAFHDWIYRALIFLVISCPCALVLSIPLGFFGGIGAASKNGILVKGGNFLEALSQVDQVAFDKTGTLTKGVFQVTQVVPEDGISGQELLEYAALAEVHSNHPIALSIKKAYGNELDPTEITHYEERAGHGVKVFARNRQILLGNRKWMEEEGIPYNRTESPAGTLLHMAIDGKYAGYLLITDEVKEDAKKAVHGLKRLGIKKIVMLSGDLDQAARWIGRQVGVDEVKAELLPHEKVAALEELYREPISKGKIAYVGDGMNDAPVLARSDIGIAMGGVGTDAAIEAADVVIMNDEPSKLVTAVQIARKTKRIVWQNIFLALGVKAFFLLLGALGMATMWEAVFADVGVSLLAVLNTLRVFRPSVRI
nr:heavy metal translocating P-type ATPase [Thermicanus aegyptius]